MILCFYEGLKDNVKDDLYREDVSDIVIKYIQRTIKIDDRLYAQCIEKHSQRLPTLK